MGPYFFKQLFSKHNNTLGKFQQEYCLEAFNVIYEKLHTATYIPLHFNNLYG